MYFAANCHLAERVTPLKEICMILNQESQNFPETKSPPYIPVRRTFYPKKIYQIRNILPSLQQLNKITRLDYLNP